VIGVRDLAALSMRLGISHSPLLLLFLSSLGESARPDKDKPDLFFSLFPRESFIAWQLSFSSDWLVFCSKDRVAALFYLGYCFLGLALAVGVAR